MVSNLDEILADLTSFMVWESQQEWEPTYDRKANRKNSQDMAAQAIQALITKAVREAKIEELEALISESKLPFSFMDLYTPDQQDFLQERIEDLKLEKEN